MALVEGRTALYAKAHRKVTVARVLASAAVLMDTVKLGAKVNLVPAPAVTSLRTAHAVARLGIPALAVPLELAARSTEVTALLLITVRLDAKANSELALGTAKSHLMAHAAVLTAIRVLVVSLETAVRNPPGEQVWRPRWLRPALSSTPFLPREMEAQAEWLLLRRRTTLAPEWT